MWISSPAPFASCPLSWLRRERGLFRTSGGAGPDQEETVLARGLSGGALADAFAGVGDDAEGGGELDLVILLLLDDLLQDFRQREFAQLLGLEDALAIVGDCRILGG